MNQSHKSTPDSIDKSIATAMAIFEGRRKLVETDAISTDDLVKEIVEPAFLPANSHVPVDLFMDRSHVDGAMAGYDFTAYRDACRGRTRSPRSITAGRLHP